MPVTPREIIRAAGRPLIRKAAGRPVGIWIFWACLAYAAYSFAPELFDSARHRRMGMPMFSEIAAVWIPFVAAAVTLVMRRLIAQVFGGISMAFLLHHAILNMDYAGIVLALLGIAGLLANRRWFYEHLPNLEK